LDFIDLIENRGRGYYTDNERPLWLIMSSFLL